MAAVTELATVWTTSGVRTIRLSGRVTRLANEFRLMLDVLEHVSQHLAVIEREALEVPRVTKRNLPTVVIVRTTRDLDVH